MSIAGLIWVPFPQKKTRNTLAEMLQVAGMPLCLTDYCQSDPVHWWASSAKHRTLSMDPDLDKKDTSGLAHWKFRHEDFLSSTVCHATHLVLNLFSFFLGWDQRKYSQSWGKSSSYKCLSCAEKIQRHNVTLGDFLIISKILILEMSIFGVKDNF